MSKVRINTSVQLADYGTQMARVIAPTLREFIAQNPPAPMALYDKPVPFFELDEVGQRCALDDMNLAWTCMLGNMLYAFERIGTGQSLDFQEMERVQRGLMNFGKYLPGMWI